MKILTIHFKNINSLQGEHLIDFNQAPLADAGVFAITGPNGSGKTSVLDAITLGLYGETFKFDRPASHVMTRHSNNCFAQVEFQIHETRYRSRWQAEKDENNTPRTSMQLIRVNDDTTLGTEAAKVRLLNAGIIGLDFRNFTRSILLAQGDFAAFLNALDSERLDILERIVNTDIYADYQQELQTNADQTYSKLQQLQTELDTIVLLDPESKAAKEADLSDFQAQKLELKEALDELTQRINDLNHLAALEDQRRQHWQRQQSLLSKQQQIADSLHLIERHQGVVALQSDFDHFGTLETDLQENQRVVADYRQELAQLHAQLTALKIDVNDLTRLDGKSLSEQQELIADLIFRTEQLYTQQRSDKSTLASLEIQLSEKQTIAHDIQNWLTAHQQDASLLEGFPDIGKLKKLGVDILHYKSQQVTLNKRAKSTSNSLSKTETEIQSIEKLIPELKDEIIVLQEKIATLSRGHSLEELETLLTEQQQRVKDFGELLTLAKINNRFKDGLLVRLGIIRQPVLLDIDVIQERLKDLNKQLAQEENIKISLEHAVFNESLLKKMQADRVHLVKGEPCPLCGSLKHPYAVHAPKHVDSQQALADQKNRIQTLFTTITQTKQQLQTAEKQAQTKQLKKDRLLRVRNDWAALSNRLSVISKDLQLDNTGLMKKLLKEQQQELDSIDDLVKNYRQYQQKIIKLSAEIHHREAVLEQLKLSYQEFSSRKVDPEELAELEQKLARAIAEEQSLSEKIQAQLNQLAEKMPGKGKEDALFKRLNNRRQEYQTYLLREKHINEEITAIQEQLKLTQTTLTNQNQQLESTKLKLETEQGFGVQLAVIEKQKILHEKELTITQLQEQIQNLRQTLLTQAKEFGVESFTALSGIFALIARQTALEQQFNELNRLIQDNSSIVEKNQIQLQNESARLASGKSLTDCETEHKNILEKIAITELEIDHLTKLLSQQQILVEKQTRLLNEQKQYQTEFLENQRELNLLTEGSGHAFRRKVQRRLADKLLSHTNRILEKISGRFYVRQAESDRGLALEIEDTFQENSRRLPKTLSGGESFVVSLALALGLSDIAGNGQTIESLFLDEGFGNLDAETLYTVISTLESLQTQGRKVGVISHVDGIRKRIKTQIELVKKPNGLSELKALA